VTRRRLIISAAIAVLGAILAIIFVALLIFDIRVMGRFDEALADAHPVAVLSFALLCLAWRRVAKKDPRFEACPRIDRRRLLLAALSAVILGLSFPVAVPFAFVGHEIPGFRWFEVFSWVGLVPLFFAIRGLRPKHAFLVAFLAGILFCNVVFWWVNVAMTTFGGMPNYLSLPVLEILAVGCAEFWGFPAALIAYATVGNRRPFWLVAPAAWASGELFRNYYFTGFPWGGLGYAQASNVWINQLAALGGVYLIAFVIVLINALVFEGIVAFRETRSISRRVGTFAGAAVSIFAVAHLYGALHVHRVESEVAAAPKFTVALLQGNIDEKIKALQYSSHGDFVLRQYNPMTEAADDSGVDLIVWPEAAHPSYLRPSDKNFRGARLSRRSYQARLLIGAGVADLSVHPYKLSNSAFMVEPNLDIAGRYDKHHLVPFGEYVMFHLDHWLPLGKILPEIGFYAPGSDLNLLTAPARQPGGPTAKIGTLICYDAIFPEIGRRFADEGANLLVNITNDAWYGYSSAAHQFLQIVALRAIETGREVARAANTGITAFIDPAGRVGEHTQLGMIDAETSVVDESKHVPPVWIRGPVPLLTGKTIYVVIGDLFAYLCVAWCLWLWADTLRQAPRA
jgi:apolipoprotein N-acyltransferase